MTKKLDFLIGASFADLIFQPTAGIIAPDNMLIINFKNENILYSIHAVCSVRINKGDKFLLNSSDEFVDENHSYLMEDNVDKSILKINIDKTKSILAKEKVESALIEECGDLIISFSNGIRLMIMPDCCIEEFEYYRILGCKKLRTIILVTCREDKVVIENKFGWHFQ